MDKLIKAITKEYTRLKLLKLLTQLKNFTRFPRSAVPLLAG